MINDWPYGNEPGILHIVAWTKSPIPTTPEDDEMTPEARNIIDAFVRKTFTDRLGEAKVLWFKNWASIQSVRSVEHVHILIRNYTEDILRDVVGKDARQSGAKPIGELVREEEEGEVSHTK